jgi:hypothetical protein
MTCSVLARGGDAHIGGSREYVPCLPAAAKLEVVKNSFFFFLADRLLEGRSPSQIAPALLKFVPARGAKLKTVAAAIQNNSWIADIQGTSDLPAIAEFITPWIIIQNQPTLNYEQDKLS